MYEAGPGAKEEVEEPAAKGRDEDEEAGAALGARIPIPTETFLEELAVKMELHPISVHWLLEEFKAEGVVSPPLRKAELEEYVDITLVRMLGYRWPEQDAYEATHGPILDPDLVDPDGIIPLVPCGDEPVAEERVRTRLVRQLGDDGADAFLADLKRYTKRDLADWIRRDYFRAHTKRFKNRPIAWHLRSPEGAFEALVLYHRLSQGHPPEASRHLRRRPPRAAAGRPAARPGPRRHRHRHAAPGRHRGRRGLPPDPRGDRARRRAQAPHPLPLEGRDRGRPSRPLRSRHRRRRQGQHPALPGVRPPARQGDQQVVSARPCPRRRSARRVRARGWRAPPRAPVAGSRRPVHAPPRTGRR